MAAPLVPELELGQQRPPAASPTSLIDARGRLLVCTAQRKGWNGESTA